VEEVARRRVAAATARPCASLQARPAGVPRRMRRVVPVSAWADPGIPRRMRLGTAGTLGRTGVLCEVHWTSLVALRGVLTSLATPQIIKGTRRVPLIIWWRGVYRRTPSLWGQRVIERPSAGRCQSRNYSRAPLRRSVFASVLRYRLSRANTVTPPRSPAPRRRGTRRICLPAAGRHP
jgi:hypothetical protein